MATAPKLTVWENVRRYLLRGFLFWIPLAAVFLVGRLIYSIIQSWFFPSLPWEPRLTALGVVIVVLVLTGWGVSQFGVARIVLRAVVERPLSRIPVARWIYSGVRQLVEALFTSGDAFGKVVLIEYPRRGVYSIAFQMAGELAEVQHRVRQRIAERNGRDGSTEPGEADAGPRDVMAVFVPTTPNPTSGFVITLPREDVIELSMSRQQALQMVISLGVVVPEWQKDQLDGEPPREPPPPPEPTAEGSA